LQSLGIASAVDRVEKIEIISIKRPEEISSFFSRFLLFIDKSPYEDDLCYHFNFFIGIQ
jgi:hypothetical protein